MKPSRLWSAGVGAALLSLAVTVHAADLTASGKVLGTDGKPLSGVTVSLALAKMSATTDASGAWNLGSTSVGIASRVAVPVANGRMMLENGRLSARFEGRDVCGRGMGRAVATSHPLVDAARAAAAVVSDTLLYSWNGKMRLRDTISVSRTGIVRTLDTTVNPSIVYGYLTDSRDGQRYRTVKIGTQVWMGQNLNFKVDSSFCYSNDTANCAKYGRLYSWVAAMGLNDSCVMKSCTRQLTPKHRGVCPIGWHMPNNAEWTKLTDTTLAAATAGTKLKAAIGWPGAGNGTDDHGFTVLPAAHRTYYGKFFDLGYEASFWSASDHTSGTYAWNLDFNVDDANAVRYHFYYSNAFSIRCLQD